MPAKVTGSEQVKNIPSLIPPLLDMTDEKKIALNPAYELSFLTQEEQTMLVGTMEQEQATPSLSQAQRMKKLSQVGQLTKDTMLAIMSEEKKRFGQGDIHHRYSPKIFPQKLYPQKDAGYHHQAAGTMAAQTPAGTKLLRKEPPIVSIIYCV